MMPTSHNNIAAKRQIRAEARRLRRELPDKDERSRKIAAALCGLPEYADAKTVVFYVDSGSEVRTRPLIEENLRCGRCVVVPYCEGDELGLFRLEDMAELAPATFGIDEPLPALRSLPERSIGREKIDLIIVPGVAFDPRGGRIGQGKGFYDRFLKTLDRSVNFVALAYQCQIFSSIPLDPHDIQMDVVVTEESFYHRTEE
jgi:5-formyltetrahydrofolate cyclo-ligase